VSVYLDIRSYKNMDKNVGIKNLTPFTSDRQPSPEAKSKGWERRREAQKILDEFMKMGDMTFAELQELLEDIKKNPDKHTVREVKLAQYMTKEKFMTDWLDRHVSKAPLQTDVTSGGEKIDKIVVEIINPINGTQN